MVDIGIVGLDTSHAEAFADTLAEQPSTSLTAVWDGGAVRSESYTEEYCDTHGANRYDEPLEMTDHVDAVMILTVDWDTHRELAVPFLERGVPTMIDKPIAGNLADISALEAAVGGTPFFGGSAVPYHSAVRSADLESDDRTLYCVGYDDPFYYGVHLVDTVCRIVDSPWACVSPADDPGRTVNVVFTDGTYATLRLDSPEDENQFSFLSIGNRTTAVDVGSTPADMTDMYRAYIETFLNVVAGEIDPSDRVFDAAALLLGVVATLEHDRPITPECRVLSEYAVDGGAFLEEYRPYY